MQGWVEFRNTFSYNISELLQASKDVCPIFERIVGSMDGDVLHLKSNATRSVDVHFDLVSVTTDRQMTSSDVKRAKISCWWMGTTEALMDYDAVKLNTYAFEAEAGVY